MHKRIYERIIHPVRYGTVFRQTPSTMKFRLSITDFHGMIIETTSEFLSAFFNLRLKSSTRQETM